MFDDINSKTTAYLLISLLCFLGLAVPVPLAPVTFFVSMGLLFLARQEYVKASLEGYPEGLRVKLGFTMAACLGNVFATIAEFALLAVAFYITLTSPMLDEVARQSFAEISPGVNNVEINIETFNQNNIINKTSQAGDNQ